MVTPTAGVLLDTHALIWLRDGSPRLGEESRRMAETALDCRALFISAASIWEAALLAEKNRIALRDGALKWRENLLAHGFKEIPMDGEIAARAAAMREMHKDPFDCIFIATAILHRAYLLTADGKILRVKMRGLSLADARK